MIAEAACLMLLVDIYHLSEAAPPLNTGQTGYRFLPPPDRMLT
jgi:hypothetical protein